MEVRLNSPCSKFEITNMVDDQVDLSLEDIPGASCTEEEIGKLTVARLKSWLKSRLKKSKLMVIKRNCWKARCTSSGFV